MSYYNVTINLKGIVRIPACGKNWDHADTLDELTLMSVLRRLLGQDGQALIFKGRVFTDFQVNNGPGSLLDVNNGPRTRVHSITPIVSNKAFEVSWSVTAAVGECPDEDGYLARSWEKGDIKQFFYEVEWDCNTKGYSQRTISGFIEIVLNHFTETTQDLTADDYRNKLTVHMPKGFRRDRNNWKLNASRTRVTFTVVDTEIESPNAFPPGVVDISIKHKVSVGGGANFTKGLNSISGHCEVANPLPVEVAWERVYPILAQRIKAARVASGGIFLTGIDITEELYSRRIDFSISYYKLESSPFSFIKDAGLFTKTDDPAGPDHTWGQWRDSMYGSAEDANDETYDPIVNGAGIGDTRLPWARRSVANLSYEPTDDMIVTPCTNQPFNIHIHNQRYTPLPASLEASLKNICPPKGKSYVTYNSRIKIVTDTTLLVLPEMPAESTVPDPALVKTQSGGPAGPRMSKKQNSHYSKPNEDSEDFKFAVIGRAARLGFEPELPKIAEEWKASVGKIPTESEIVHAKKNVNGCTLYMVSWVMVFQATGVPELMVADLGNLHETLFKTEDIPDGSLGDS